MVPPPPLRDHDAVDDNDYDAYDYINRYLQEGPNIKSSRLANASEGEGVFEEFELVNDAELVSSVPISLRFLFDCFAFSIMAS